MKLKLKALNGEDSEFEVELSTKLSEFRQRVSEHYTIPYEEVKLIFGGRVLTNDDNTISSLGLSDGFVLHMVRRSPMKKSQNRTNANEQGTNTTENGSNTVGEVPSLAPRDPLTNDSSFGISSSSASTFYYYENGLGTGQVHSFMERYPPILPGVSDNSNQSLNIELCFRMLRRSREDFEQRYLDQSRSQNNEETFLDERTLQNFNAYAREYLYQLNSFIDMLSEFQTVLRNKLNLLLRSVSEQVNSHTRSRGFRREFTIQHRDLSTVIVLINQITLELARISLSVSYVVDLGGDINVQASLIQLYDIESHTGLFQDLSHIMNYARVFGDIRNQILSTIGGISPNFDNIDYSQARRVLISISSSLFNPGLNSHLSHTQVPRVTNLHLSGTTNSFHDSNEASLNRIFDMPTDTDFLTTSIIDMPGVISFSTNFPDITYVNVSTSGNFSTANTATANSLSANNTAENTTTANNTTENTTTANRATANNTTANNRTANNRNANNITANNRTASERTTENRARNNRNHQQTTTTNLPSERIAGFNAEMINNFGLTQAINAGLAAASRSTPDSGTSPASRTSQASQYTWTHSGSTTSQSTTSGTTSNGNNVRVTITASSQNLGENNASVTQQLPQHYQDIMNHDRNTVESHSSVAQLYPSRHYLAGSPNPEATLNQINEAAEFILMPPSRYVRRLNTSSEAEPVLMEIFESELFKKLYRSYVLSRLNNF